MPVVSSRLASAIMFGWKRWANQRHSSPDVPIRSPSSSFENRGLVLEALLNSEVGRLSYGMQW